MYNHDQAGKIPNYPVLCSKLVNQLGLVNFTYQGETISVFVYVAIDSAAVTIHNDDDGSNCVNIDLHVNSRTQLKVQFYRVNVCVFCCI